ncbi:MAG: amidohydrolase family protein, partial [Deltaproteobacteria bacterium]|nr:amidohydrolase family protein [Deltaproteobacteria bacterium]
MAKKGFKVLDSDMHIMEPPDLWERYIDSEFKGQGPRGLVRTNVRESALVHSDGRRWGSESRGGVTRGQNFNRTQTLYRSHADRGWSAEVQLEAMDQEGIDLAVLYPTRGLHALAEPNMEPRLAAAIARAYNNWLYEFCQTDPERLLGGAMISPFSIEDAVSEVRRCAGELGFRGVFIRANIMNERNWYDDYYEPLWSTLEEFQIPLGL